jgi:hypothetical protein
MGWKGLLAFLLGWKAKSNVVGLPGSFTAVAVQVTQGGVVQSQIVQSGAAEGQGWQGGAVAGQGVQ